MATLTQFLLKPDHVIYLANLAAVVSLICGMGLLAVWACRRCSTPLRHGILICVLALTLLCPVSVWLGQQKGLALIRVAVSIAGAAGQPDFSSDPAPPPTSPGGSGVLPSQPRHGLQGPAPTLPLGLSGVESSTRPPHDMVKAGRPLLLEDAAEAQGQSSSPLPYGDRQSLWWQVIGTFAAWAWAIGILVGVLRLGMGYVAVIRIRRSFRQVDPRVAELGRRAADDMGRREAPPLFVSPSIPIPLSLGLVRPAIVLPTDLADRMNDAQLQAILVHEMAHIVRRDPWVGLAQRLAVAVFWWNPLVHKVSDQVSRLREDLCDNYVVRVQGDGEDFARTLVDVASQITVRPGLPATVGVLESNLDGLTERIHRLIGKERDMATRMSIGSIVLVLTCGLAVLVGTGLIRCLQAAEVAPAVSSLPPSSNAQTEGDGAKTPSTPVGADAARQTAWYYHVKTGGTGGRPVQREADPGLASCWNSIVAAFAAVKSRATPGPWIIQVDDEATYDEAVALTDLQTSATETLTLTKAPWLAGRPTIYPSRPGKRAPAINGLWTGVANSEPLPDQPGQPARRVTYVTVRGFTLKNNAQGTDKTTEQPLFSDKEDFFTEGLHIIEDCCFDGQDQVYDASVPVFVTGPCIDTIFRRNTFQDLKRNEESMKQGRDRELFLISLPSSTIVGQPQVTIADNTFCRNRGTVFVSLADVPNQRYYKVVFERNTLRDNYFPSILATIWRNPFSNIVRNNIFANNSGSSAARATYEVLDASNTKIYHNTFFNNHVPREVSIRTDSLEGVEIKNNIFWPTPGSYCIEVVPGSTENLVCANNAFFTDFQKDGYPPGFGFSTTENTEIVGLWNGKPMTADAWNKASKNNSGNGYTFEGPGLDKNMHLVAGSLCIDRGVGGLAGDDIDGKPRPVGVGCDIGADEYSTPGTALAGGGKREIPLEGQQMGPGSPICLAAHAADVAAIERCIQEGADVDKLDGRGYAPLHYAAQNDQKRAVETLLAKGADANVKDLQGQTPLFHASAAGNRGVAELLISRGAQVDVRDKDGRTALHTAAAGQHQDVAELLISKGAEVNAKDKDGKTALHRAVDDQQENVVGLLVSKGADLNAKDKDGKTALHRAVDDQQKDVVGLLVSKGAELNAKDRDGFTPLYHAIWNGDQEMMKLLVTKGADVNYTPKDEDSPLHGAVFTKDVNTVRLLVDHGAKIDVKNKDGWSALHYAVLRGNQDIVDFLVSKGIDTSTLPLAACAGDLDRVKSLVEQGAEVDAKDERGWTPLCWAVCAGRTEVLRFLIAKGAQARAEMANGQTPLHVVAGNGRRDLAELLVAGGADLNAKNGIGLAPVHEAARNGHRQVVELLLAKGADVNAKAPDDSTPLHLAAVRGHNDVVGLLIAKGADMHAITKSGRTPLKLAVQYRCTATVKLLQEHGAKE
jgi:ankyrin repeat protein/beta-lactamase regulating signal transducer with metallopeptidase domain